ncbi:hypothetical protein QR680_005803 [Steinernema hermaphroditum]|uniref:Amino acid transporter transmembrane domain-containing protein n=1 Tax=Steinernema hermaphroditum TaxID=289476 RepID=A0AA39HUS3_9BILA|nr:hypothetical protein QR680_005803 [Steinernema hermaphroditum]
MAKIRSSDVDLKLGEKVLSGPPSYSSGDSEKRGIRREKIRNAHGLNWFITGLFVVGDMAGGGLVALPTAIIRSGFWAGLIITSFMTCVVTYSAYCLGQNWVIMQKLWPEYRDHCRKPYAEMGYRTLGPTAKTIVSICIDVTQFGIAVVYLLLASKNIHDSIKAFSGGSVNLDFCYVVLILACCLLPVTFLKSPQDFWWAVVLAMVTTTVAVILIIVGSIIDHKTCHGLTELPDFKITNYFLALGTFLFSYGGHSAFPTIQHDMRKPYQFTRSAIMAFIMMEVMYLPVCIMGYVTYGSSLRDSIINSIQTNWIQQAINMLITIHCILTLTIVFNPINQEAEEIFRVPQHFCLKRVVIRTSMMVAVVFVAESLPTFGPLLDLMGGSTVTLTSIVFPCLFYAYFLTIEKKMDEKRPGVSEFPSIREVLENTPRLTLIACSVAIIFGVFGGGAATYSAIVELSTTQFAMPCYVKPFVHSKDDSLSGHTSCCGPWSNITWGPKSACSPYSKFY